ncbi:hypothetical protein P2G88_15715 [Aliiglaciecola sp. CAU 1673]|uniref:hypothetical protein n=1 Tax=Aliiglaciecola sp. CAU 1673 TaxID=3032595 RepID=UPI0023DA86E0|nr:hypothetical protein [Aliiglaciecola sp. CAU 1673]MDF2179698.1 hypothetical protein [Aliiglaciecola sp. CAU 1673]
MKKSSFPLLLLASMLSLAGCSSTNTQEDGQCWSQKGGVGLILKNSSTKEECKELGGKSWCAVGGSCVDLD